MRRRTEISDKEQVLQAIEESFEQSMFVSIEIIDIKNEVNRSMLTIKDNNNLIDYHFIETSITPQLVNMFRELKKKVEIHEKNE